SIPIHTMLTHKSQTMIRIAVFLVVSILLTGVPKELCAQQPASPNIVFICADDLGWSSLSSRMDKSDPQSASDYHQTSNLDRLAAAGIRFSRAYAPESICSPSRRSILFGHTPARQGDESFGTNYPPTAGNYPTLPQVLKGIDSH